VACINKRSFVIVSFNYSAERQSLLTNYPITVNCLC
jgi:hypothetical protein